MAKSFAMNSEYLENRASQMLLERTCDPERLVASTKVVFNSQVAPKCL